MDDIGGYSYLGGAAEKKKGAALTKQLDSIDYNLTQKMKKHGLTSADMGDAKAMFALAEQTETWSGANVASAAVERSMLKMLKKHLI